MDHRSEFIVLGKSRSRLQNHNI